MAQRKFILLLYIALTCVMFSKINTFSLPMIPIDSPHLQIFPQNMYTQQRLELLKNITMSRASIYSLISSKTLNSSSRVNSFESSMNRVLSNFYVTQLFFGTSDDLFSAYVLVDTGSENTWVQCDGCNPCFELRGGNIQIEKSVSYKYLSKDDPRCNPKRIISHQLCGYKAMYGGGAVSIGAMVTDNFMFQNLETKKPEFFPDVAFGCGFQNHDFDFGLNTGPNNVIAGIFGMSPGPQSLITQLDSTIKGRFSYCLTSWTEQNQGMSTMHYGDDAQISGPGLQQISMNGEVRYHLYFRGISVDGNRLPNIGSSICPHDPNRGSGFVIDSGAPYSLITETAYNTLGNAVSSYFARHGWEPLEGQIFDHCFKSGRSGVDYGTSPFPEVIFHFSRGDGSGEEVDWVMKKENMFLKLDNVEGFCMVVIKTPDESKFCLFGAYQHADFNVLYDARNSKLFFKPQRCQENT